MFLTARVAESGEVLAVILGQLCVQQHPTDVTVVDARDLTRHFELQPRRLVGEEVITLHNAARRWP